MSTRIRWTSSVMGSPGCGAAGAAGAGRIASLLQDQARPGNGNGHGTGVGGGRIGGPDSAVGAVLDAPRDGRREVAGLERLADEAVGAGLEGRVLELRRPADHEDGDLGIED